MRFDKEHYNVCVFVTSHDNYVLETVQRRKRLNMKTLDLPNCCSI